MSAESESVEAEAGDAAPRPGLAERARRLLGTPLLLLKRLRRSRTPEDEGAPEAAPAESGGSQGKAEDAAPDSPLLWRRLLPYGLVLLAGVAAGGGAFYWLSDRIIARQSAELRGQEDEITRLKGVLAGYDKMMLENRKKLEEEKGKRAELGNRLATAQSDLSRRSSVDGGDAGTPGQAGADKALDCTLRPGSVGNTLKACLEEFNRKPAPARPPEGR